jgi:peptidoglycan/xylan/chitin deacetylase (PgdA/CDA1 family)
MRRLDRSITLGLHVLAGGLAVRAARRVPVLMYHSIGNDTRPGHPYFGTNTSIDVFRSHLQFLRDNGYTVVDVNEIAAAVASGACNNTVAITFDDGFRDFHSHALPLLIEFGSKATMYIISAIPAAGRGTLHGKELMSWDEVKEIQRHGISIGSHTVKHPELYTMAHASIEYELRASKNTIEDKLGTAVQSFAYPFAFPEADKPFVNRFRNLLQDAGYENGVTTIIGTVSDAHDRFFYPRLPANSYDDLCFLEAKLAGSYDWMHLPQYLAKKGRALRRNAASPASA